MSEIIGSIYRSNDPRDYGREVQVCEVDGQFVKVENILTGRRSHIDRSHLDTARRNGWSFVRWEKLPDDKD